MAVDSPFTKMPALFPRVLIRDIDSGDLSLGSWNLVPSGRLKSMDRKSVDSSSKPPKREGQCRWLRDLHSFQIRLKQTKFGAGSKQNSLPVNEEGAF